MDKILYIAEIGLNHNGDIKIAKQIIDAAVQAGVDAVKFQKRTPDLCVPEDQKSVMRETPWGLMSYLDYRRRIEFDEKEYDEINEYCEQCGISWFASSWDIPSQKFLRKYNLSYNKVASAMLTYEDLLHEMASEKRHTFISTGMSTWNEIESAVEIFRHYDCPFTLMHCTSTYPTAMEELNLNVIPVLKDKFPDSVGVGFSNHSPGILACSLAVSLGATCVEGHCTIRRNMWGTDQSNSLEPNGLEKMIRDCNNVHKILGDGTKKVYESEKPIRKKLRKY